MPTVAKIPPNVIQFPLRGEGNRRLDEMRGFYLPREAARIARVRRSTVTLWNKKGIVVPNVRWVDENANEALGYSFAGLVYLRLLRMLRNESFPLRKAVNAVSHLTDRFGPPGPNWEQARIFSDGTDLWVDRKDEWEVTAATRRGQKVAHQMFGPEFALLRARADALLVPSGFSRYVEIDPGVRNGLPVIRNTTIQTALIRSLRLNGLTYQQIREYYPHLSREQIARSDRYEQFLDIENKAA